MSSFTERTGSQCENASRYELRRTALLNVVYAEEAVVDAPVVVLPELTESADE
jgi:hypothetical protein